MRRAHALTALIATLAAGAASAECTAEYKAKREDPYALERGSMQVPDDACDPAAAEAYVAAQLAAQGWTLLSLVSVSK